MRSINNGWGIGISLLLMTISVFIPGHIRIYLGWTAGFLIYLLVYFLIAYLYKFQRLPLWTYLSIIAIFFFFLPVYTFIDNPALWYPQIMPAYILIGLLGILSGLFLVFKEKKATSISLSVSFVIIAILHFRIDSFLYNTTVNPTIHQKLLAVSPAYSFIDMNKGNVNYRDFAGKVVVLDFWFTGCGICINKMGTYDSLYNFYKNRNDVVILSVAVGSYDTFEQIQAFKKKRKILCPVVYDQDGAIARKYSIGKDGYPLELRIGKDGSIQEVIEGFTSSDIYFEKAVESINSLLNKKVL